MKKISYLILLCFYFSSFQAVGQCEIKNKIQPDGTMVYFFDPAVFYSTKSKSLKINILTDKEHYFIALQPTPFPDRKEGKKIKDDLTIILADHNTYTLSHFDTQYRNNDSIMEVLYLMDQKDLEAFSNYEAVTAKINMKGTEFVRDYNFKLHKTAIMEQIKCIRKEE
ncbi:hypothetical protein J0383_13955 [Flavobacterium endoglycinae]|uniref:DUF4369 domain-containing protein n=1 Tax=Flavobacterium endoglycinae TaxID=2816357 RepID=A0ABX7Q9U2_9FLAO|nr:hypothetical protein [Flavobacterium endoglycinae]QSW87391.1 hypothetical protein J0383_13955 [Flavobacterium endoglycinae]